MDIVIILVSLIFMVLGVLGSFLPVLPGPLTSWMGLLILHLSNSVTFSTTFLVITCIIAVTIMVLDYIIPAAGTKRFGGSRLGVIGTTVGLIIGLIAPIPFGIIIGPFLGALIGELLHKDDMRRATKAAFGSFVGFITSTFLKFIIAVVYFGFFISKVFNLAVTWF